MKRCSKCNVDKQLDLFSKCAANKDGFHRWCKECSKASKKEWYVKNAESERSKALKYHYENYEKNKERIIKTANEWQNRNKDRYKEIAKKCYEKTKNKKFAWQAFARAAKRNAVPKWINEDLKQEIQKFYVEARLKTRETGTKYEVDHIVPLMGKEVCGLHVPWNLRVITQFENRSKQNSFKE